MLAIFILHDGMPTLTQHAAEADVNIGFAGFSLHKVGLLWLWNITDCEGIGPAFLTFPFTQSTIAKYTSSSSPLWTEWWISCSPILNALLGPKPGLQLVLKPHTCKVSSIHPVRLCPHSSRRDLTVKAPSHKNVDVATKGNDASFKEGMLYLCGDGRVVLIKLMLL